MENASKALIIAGAILLSILIIAIGMYVYNSSTSSIDTAVGQMNSNEIQSFNRQFTQYSGKQSGANVIALLSTVASNAATNAGADEKLPDVYSIGITAGSTKPAIQVVSNGQASNVSGINTAKNSIVNSHGYYVNFEYDPDTGLVAVIVINYSPTNAGYTAPTPPAFTNAGS